VEQQRATSSVEVECHARVMQRGFVRPEWRWGHGPLAAVRCYLGLRRQRLAWEVVCWEHGVDEFGGTKQEAFANQYRRCAAGDGVGAACWTCGLHFTTASRLVEHERTSGHMHPETRAVLMGRCDVEAWRNVVCWEHNTDVDAPARDAAIDEQERRCPIGGAGYQCTCHCASFESWTQLRAHQDDQLARRAEGS
jgi:hypothetical protein